VEEEEEGEEWYYRKLITTKPRGSKNGGKAALTQTDCGSQGDKSLVDDNRVALSLQPGLDVRVRILGAHGLNEIS